MSDAKPVECLHLPPGQSPPNILGAPFRAVLVIDEDADPEWRKSISEWLVQSRCLYVMAWGTDCEVWHDSVDWANLEAHDYGDIADDDFIMTTWHAKDPLEEAFWFAKFCAFHPTVPLPRLIILHIAASGRCEELIGLYEQAAELEDEP
jgi:hypothetical protein